MIHASRFVAALFAAVMGITAIPVAVADEITVRRYARQYQPGDYGFAARGRPVQTILLGNPIGATNADFAANFLPGLRDAMRSGRSTFVPADPGRPPGGHFVVLAFDPPSGVRLTGVCRKPTSLGTDRRQGKLRLLALLCRGDTPLAQVQGEMAKPTGTDDPSILRLARRAIRDLVPRRRPYHGPRPMYRDS